MSADARDEAEIRPDPALDAVVAHASELARMDGDVRRVRVSSAAGSVELEFGGTQPDPAGAAPGSTPDDANRSAGLDPTGLDSTGLAEDVHRLLSPMVGTFYRAPESGADAFVSVGDVVGPGRQVGIVEAMKLMNALETEHGGRVLEFLVDDGAVVEYGQPLIAFRVDVEG